MPELISEQAATEADFAATTDVAPLFVELESEPQPRTTGLAASARAEPEPPASPVQPATQVTPEPVASFVTSDAPTPEAAVLESENVSPIATVIPALAETSSGRDATEQPVAARSTPTPEYEDSPGLVSEPAMTGQADRVGGEARSSSSSEPASPAHPAIELRVSRYAPPPRAIGESATPAESTRRIADELFSPTETDRSPQSWLARLVEAARAGSQPAGAQVNQMHRADRPPATGSSPSSPRATMTSSSSRAEPLRTETRRFLAPRVGIDPASVPIHRGSEADRVRSAFNADAVTVGQEVFLPAGFSEESPEGQGLLAHELTHVARAREPRFVPPVVTQGGPTPGVSRRTVDEETLATHVEARVRQQARQLDRPVSHSPESLPGDSTDAVAAPIAPHAPSVDPFWPNQAPAVTQSRATEPDEPDWGGLPTPWEPLPGWMVASSETPEPAALGVELGPATAIAPPPAAPAVQRADPARTVESEAPAAREESGEPPRDEAGQHVEPDLDALARQVYGVLRRRLAAERRRAG